MILASESAAINITDLKATIVYVYSGLQTDNHKFNSLKEEVMNLKRCNIILEAYTRRENINIFCIEDEQGESNTRTKELVRTCIMMHKKTNIPGDVRDFHCEQEHQIPTHRGIHVYVLLC